MSKSTLVLLFSGFLLLLSGCGAVSSNMRSTATAESTSSPNRGRPQNDGQYLATMFVLPGREPSLFGTISLNMNHDNGSGNLQLSNLGIENETLLFEFCPYPQEFGDCINITSLTTDANGQANVNFTFSQHGTYAGLFSLWDTNGQLVGAAITGSSGISFQSSLLPAAQITGGIAQTTGKVNGNGVIVVNGTTAHITLTGTTPNHTFSTTLTNLFVGEGIAMANVTTDSHGNASVDIGEVQPAGLGVFLLSDSDGIEFVNAFQVH